MHRAILQPLKLLESIMQLKFSMLRWRSRTMAFCHDLLAIPFAWLGAYWFRFNLGSIPHEIIAKAILILPFLIFIQATAFLAFGLYRGIWKFASLPDLLRIIKAVVVGSAVSALCVTFFIQMQYVPRSVFPLYSLFLITALGGSRLLYRWLRQHANNFSNAKRVLIIGGGQAGEGLIRDLLRDTSHTYNPVAVVDDDLHKQGFEIHGIRVQGKIENIPEIVKSRDIELILIAMPSASSASMRRVVGFCEKTMRPFRTLPGLMDLASGHVSINALREVSIEDLLGREPISLDWASISHGLTGKVVLISGGGGSIGSELCRQIALLNPAKLVVIENSEFNLYALDLELRQRFPNLKLHIHLGDVTDRIAVQQVLAQHKPEVIFHAAAYKHVPLLESQLRAAIRNNILGTWIVAEEAVANGVKQFTLISTDKAVNPSNIMGATKRAAEIICQNFNSHSNTHFVTVRFGNVLGSAGSVVPLFRQQIAAGGPVTVTHPEIARFFMTIPEATQLILQATVMGRGGEIFVLNMGEPIKIAYLAEQMIQLAGLKVGEDIEIQYTGLRPGEKLSEELFHQSEQLVSTGHEKILQAHYRPLEWQVLVQMIEELNRRCNDNNEPVLCALLHKLVPEYKGFVVDIFSPKLSHKADLSIAAE